MRFIYRKCMFFLLTAMGLMGCKKFVEVTPPVTELVATTVYSTNATAAAALSGIYIDMEGSSVGGGGDGLSLMLGLSSDELSLYPGTSNVLWVQTYRNALLSSNPPTFWGDLYNYIYQANSAIEGLNTSTGVTTSMKQQLLGEAEFIRAFCLFYLVNIYGDVPLVTTTNYLVNEAVARTPKEQVYRQIVSDLLSAQAELSDNFLGPDGTTTTERVRPNRGAATALLARVYLYQEKWDSAELEATAVINNSNYSLVQNLDSAFLANNNEAIWQLELPSSDLTNTPDAAVFLLPLLYLGGPSVSYPIFLNTSLVKSFENGDFRRANWVDSIVVDTTIYYYPFKYSQYYTGQPPVQYPTIFRLAEQYLIRAEAEAELNETNAIADLNIIRNRARLSNYSGSTDQGSLLSEIYLEEKWEFFTEYGHRWFDLIRTDRADVVMGVATVEKGGSWVTEDQLYPIPLTEIQNDVNLKQNPGYN